MSRRNRSGPKLELKLNLSPPPSQGEQMSMVRSPMRSNTASPNSCVSSEPSQEEMETPISMVLVGCPRCLMYVMLSQDEPKCPKCKSTRDKCFVASEVTQRRSVIINGLCSFFNRSHLLHSSFSSKVFASISLLPLFPSYHILSSPLFPQLLLSQELRSQGPGRKLSQCRYFFFALVKLSDDDLPLVGNKAPDFEAEAVFDQEFIKVKLSEYIGKKYVILFFYPLDFTFVCPTEITAFSDRYAEFEKLNTEVLGVSVDSVFSHLAWVQTDRQSGGLGDLNYPLVSDVTKSISKSFGVLIHDQGIALRGLFIIDKEGVIQHSTINNLGIGRSVDETMRTLQALQYIQENPDEVCPAGWQPGEKSMKPDPKLSKEYFSAI
ncbi:hypothetical protein F2Q69_00031908 [Brassica cretica]|uniref:thioredoxin-dependent peroxiredoxin n=1 Tax=Brassica cretica TaxID=69181 RepID=A0A8S9RZ89_BRACR|nr:hypothetical protein F2Q69_00031908 [Brassica cretica]